MTVRRRSQAPRWIGLTLALCCALAAQPALAQKRRPRPLGPASAASAPITVPAAGSNTSLRTRSGFGVASRLVRSDREENRVQGLERLGNVGTPQALELLIKALEPGGAARSSRERLTAVRALADHIKTPAIRALLGRVAAGVGSSGERSDELDGLVRDTAALALARSGEPDDLELLGKTLRQPGRLAESAANALLAYPPRSLAPLLRGRFAPTRELARTLGDLGDQRAVEPLRDFVKRGSPEIRAAAAHSLTRLGHYETVELARHWLRSERQPLLLEAAARILILAGAPEQSSAVAALFASKETLSAGLALAHEAALPALLPVLSRELERAEPEEERWIIATLGRIEDPEAVRELERALSKPERAPAAAYALALHPAKEARAALSRALLAPGPRRDALRAAVVRKIALGENVDHLTEALRLLEGSKDGADRAAAGWAAAALEPERLEILVKSSDPVVARAAARAVLVGGDPQHLAERLIVEKDELTRTQLAVALAFERGANRVPTTTLIELLDEDSPAAPLAARALSERDAPNLRPRIEALLASGDGLLRSHAALGLGSSDSPSAAGLLARALRFEPDADVRRAIVVALSQHPGAARRRPLELAAALDPDPAARGAARRALSGQKLDPLGLGVSSVWFGSTTSAADDPVTAIALIGPAGGVLLPAVADPDGRIVLSGLGFGPLSLRLAAAPLSSNASARAPR
jgi:HEAT repeat protein